MNIKEFLSIKDEYIEKAISTSKEMNILKDNIEVDISCIEGLDEIIEYIQNLRKKGLIENDVIWNISVYFGTLLGEMIIKADNGRWIMNENDIPVVEIEPGNYLSPITKIEKILLDDEDGEGTPSSFYGSFKALLEYQAMSDEEKEKITTYV